MTQERAACRRFVSVKLQGEVGQHLLDMRVLRFVRARYPMHAIVVRANPHCVYGPLQIASLSPVVERVKPTGEKSVTPEDPRRGEDVDEADISFDALSEDLFVCASITLQVPVFEILASRPELVISGCAGDAANKLLAPDDRVGLLGVHVPHDPSIDGQLCKATIKRLLSKVLEVPNIVAVNIVTHASDCEMIFRPEQHTSVGKRSDGVVTSVNQPLDVLAALLERCHYLISADGDVKQLAWALGVPHTFVRSKKPNLTDVLRRMPDVHRMLAASCSNDELQRHAADAIASISNRTSCRERRR